VQWSCAWWEIQAEEDSSGHGRILDGGDEPHRSAAARAAQCVHLEDALKQGRPSHPAGIAGGADGAWSRFRFGIAARDGHCGGSAAQPGFRSLVFPLGWGFGFSWFECRRRHPFATPFRRFHLR